MYHEIEEPSPAILRAAAVFRRAGGTMRMADALRSGISRTTLYAMRDEGHLEQHARGLYRLASAPEYANPDLAVVGARIPRGVVCLVSALVWHDLTTQIPRSIDVALPRGSEAPRLDYPPVTLHWFSRESFRAGVEEHVLDGVGIRVYSAEKSIADAFKFRNQIGKDVAYEALKTWLQRPGFRVRTLLAHARTCRVHGIVAPALEALLA